MKEEKEFLNNKSMDFKNGGTFKDPLVQNVRKSVDVKTARDNKLDQGRNLKSHSINKIVNDRYDK